MKCVDASTVFLIKSPITPQKAQGNLSVYEMIGERLESVALFVHVLKYLTGLFVLRAVIVGIGARTEQ